MPNTDNKASEHIVFDHIEMARYLEGIKISGNCHQGTCSQEAVRYIGVNSQIKSCSSPYCLKQLKDKYNNIEQEKQPLI